MGRWKRKKEQQKLKQRIQRSLLDGNGNGSATSVSSSQPPPKSKAGFSYKDRKIILQYLKDYRDGAFAIYHGNKQLPQASSESQEPIAIASHNFPLLTYVVLRQPYLMLPKDLSSKQRRAVHDMCMDGENIGIFLLCISALYSPKSYSLLLCVLEYYCFQWISFTVGSDPIATIG
jgi:hypothetical protein